MSDSPGDLLYTKDHEWVRIEDDGSLVVGITDHAQEALGDLVYVELPETDLELEPGDGLAVVESVKAASDVYTPSPGTVIAVNEALADTPELINSDAFGEGWIARLKTDNRDSLNDLMNADAYDQYLLDSDDE